MLPGLLACELPHDAVEVGRVAEAWGVKGWFKVLPYNTDPEAVFSSKRWFLLPAQRGTFDGVGKLAIIEAKHHSDTVVACARDVNDRNGADALRGARIFISRSSFPSTQKDEYYWVDLIGLDVVNREGLPLGVVQDLHSSGLQTLLIIEDICNGKTRQRMIPFVSVFIDDVDLTLKRILVDWQADD